MVEEVVKNWIDALMDKHDVRAIEDLPHDVLVDEIAEANGNIQNCRVWNDRFGIACSKYYIELLEDALST